MERCKYTWKEKNIVLEQSSMGKQNITLDEFQEPDKTYITLLERLPGIDINQFNAILKKRNLKELGSKSNSKKG